MPGNSRSSHAISIAPCLKYNADMRRRISTLLMFLAFLMMAGRSNLITAGTSSQIDLLANFNLTTASKTGSWGIEQGVVTSLSGNPARLALSQKPPGAYDITLIYDRPSGGGDVIALYLPVGQHAVVLMSRPDVMGLDRVAGRRFDENVTTHLANFGGRSRHAIRVRVSPEPDQARITVAFDGQTQIDWRGPESALSLNNDWAVPEPYGIAIGAWNTHFHFREARLISLDGPMPATKPVATNNDGSRGKSGSMPPPQAAPAVRNTAATDVNVTCARPEPGAAPLSAGPSDPTVVERPEYRTRPKPLMKSLTSVTSMMVLIHEDGDETGVVDDIIAVVPPDSRRQNRSGVGFVLPDGDDSMKVAFNEAVRAVTLRYPVWEPGHIDISFGEKFVGHGGPSAGCAFGLLMLSTLEGFELDPKCAVTGDITVDWKVRQVGGVAAKLHGAGIEKCELAVIPAKDSMAFQDMALLYDISALWDVQVFGADTLQDEVAVARKDRSKELYEAIEIFADLRGKLRQPGKAMSVLHKPTTKETLSRILELAPNDLSAKFLLEIANNSAPHTLSVNASLYRLGVAFYPFEKIIFGTEPLTRNTLPVSVTNIGRSAWRHCGRSLTRAYFPW